MRNFKDLKSDRIVVRYGVTENLITRRIFDEINKAETKHPDFARTLPDALLVIGEELGEAQRAYLQYQYEGGNWEEIRKELIQTGATLYRALLNLDEYIENIALERITAATASPETKKGISVERDGLGLLGLWMDEAATKPRIETDPVFKAMVEQKYREATKGQAFSPIEIREAAKVVYGNYDSSCYCADCRDARRRGIAELEAKLYGKIVKECEDLANERYSVQAEAYAMLRGGMLDFTEPIIKAGYVGKAELTEFQKQLRAEFTKRSSDVFSLVSGLGKTKPSSVVDRRDVDYNERVASGIGNYPSLAALYAKHMGGEFSTISRIGGEPGDVISTLIRVRKSRVTFARYYNSVSSDAACINQFERWVKINSPEGYDYSHSVAVRTPDDRIKRTVVYKRTKAGQK